jgi:hypothetical protein
VITGIHAIVFSPEAEKVRGFFADVLGLPSVDAGGGWPIFALPPAVCWPRSACRTRVPGVESWRPSHLDPGIKRRQASCARRAVRGTPDADVYVTIDSDGILDQRALAELLKPLADPRVQSAAGIVLAANNRVNLLALSRSYSATRRACGT